MSLAKTLQWLGTEMRDVLRLDGGRVAISRDAAARLERPETIHALVRDPMSLQLASWAAEWARNGMPQIEVGHRLAASLMATTMDRESAGKLALPWSAFRLILPTGLLSAPIVESGPDIPWVTTLVFAHPAGAILTSLGENTEAWHTNDRALADLGEDFRDDEPTLGASLDDRDKRCLGLVDRLVLGVLAELASPERSAEVAKHERKAAERQRRPGALPNAWTYVLRRDVRVDCRASIGSYVDGAGSRPSVQVLVRGHWKRQRYGERHALTKWIHVEPYWRGPEDAPVAVRSHRLPSIVE